MTREEAIEYIKSRCIGSATERDGTQWSDAMWMAIEALQDLSKPNNTCEVDLISRQDAIDATWFEPSYTDPMNVLTEVRDRLEELPSAQPERKGEWIYHHRTDLGEKLNDMCECSCCGKWFSICDLLYRSFCPNCGAKMLREDD